MPKYSIIVAVDKNNLIGNGETMPWKIAEDMTYFKKVTMGHIVVMGRATFESIGKPLPGRKNIILSKSVDNIEGATVCNSIEEIEQFVPNDDIVFIIGGGSVYKQFLDRISYLYITRIDAEFKGTVFFPEIDYKEWDLISIDEIKSDYGLKFEVYYRKCK